MVETGGQQGEGRGSAGACILSCSCPSLAPSLCLFLFSLQELLQHLVERGEVGCRVLTAGGSQYTVYWLKKQHGTYVDGALSVTDPLYDSHELFGEGDE